MSAIFSPIEAEKLARPHVARAWFVALHLPTGLLRLHSGVGRVNVGGYEWRGVTDPIGGRLVSIQGVEEPAFGQAAAVSITLTGITQAFLQSFHSNARVMEGAEAEIYWAAFDAETQEVIIGLKKLFPHATISAPAIQWSGLGTRTVSLTIESIWSSQNFAPGGKWNSADQKRRYPGDLGLDFVGVKVEENWS